MALKAKLDGSVDLAYIKHLDMFSFSCFILLPINQ